jgi:holo-[acyl-carrier protein] synthase
VTVPDLRAGDLGGAGSPREPAAPAGERGSEPGGTCVPPHVRVGTDVVAVQRVLALLSRQPSLAPRVFTARELSYCEGRRRRGEHLAARFAAKEAVLKALGTGLGTRMRWTDVEVVNGFNGRPRACLHGEVAAAARRCGMRHLDISLSHAAGLAVACVALVCLEEPR